MLEIITPEAPNSVRLQTRAFNEILTERITERHIEIKFSDKIFRLPYSLQGLKDEIDASKYITELEEGWGDEEDGEQYDIKVWQRAAEGLISMYMTSVNFFGVIPDFPQIYHGPDGSVDILWEKSDFQILANCPKEENRQATYYGEITDKESFKGSFCLTDACNSLLMILVGIKKCTI